MNAKKSYKWGILAPGKIAHKFALALNGIENANIYAVGSRDITRAEAFAKKFRILHAYDSYSKLIKDPDIDIIYIATPHHLHYEMTRLCLENGKSVLCEKPVCINAKQFEELSILAKSKKLFYMDAFWTRFLPSMEKCLELLPLIGDIKYFYASFGFSAPFNASSRAYDPLQGGGSLLDIGIYPVFMSKLILGEPDEISAKAVIGKTGTDDSISLIFKYNYGALASLNATFLAETNTIGEIAGTKGSITLKNQLHHPSEIILSDENGKKESFPFENIVNGYEYEAMECMNCLDQGLLESVKLPHSFTLELMKLLDKIRKEIGLKYIYDE